MTFLTRLQKNAETDGIEELCLNKDFREKFIKKLEENKLNTSLRPEFCEWLGWILGRLSS